MQDVVSTTKHFQCKRDVQLQTKAKTTTTIPLMYNPNISKQNSNIVHQSKTQLKKRQSAYLTAIYS